MAVTDTLADFDTQLVAGTEVVLDNLDLHTQGLNLPELVPTDIADLALAPAASFVAVQIVALALVASLLLGLGYWSLAGFGRQRSAHMVVLPECTAASQQQLWT